MKDLKSEQSFTYVVFISKLFIYFKCFFFAAVFPSFSDFNYLIKI